MLTAADYADARAMQEAIMTDTATLRRRTGSTFDQAANDHVPVWETIWSGKCRVQAQNVGAGSQPVGEQQVSVQSYACAVPWDTPDMQTDDQLLVTSTPDSRLTGKPLTITSVQMSSFLTCRRFIAVDNEG